MTTVLLDAGLVGLACSIRRGRNAALDAEAVRFGTWLDAAVLNHQLIIADVTRYEVRRELVRLDATARLRRFDEITGMMASAAVTMEERDRAAELWAMVRRQGRPTAAAEALDGDAILAAVALGLGDGGAPVVVATTNIRHLAWFGVDARDWRDI